MNYGVCLIYDFSWLTLRETCVLHVHTLQEWPPMPTAAARRQRTQCRRHTPMPTATVGTGWSAYDPVGTGHLAVGTEINRRHSFSRRPETHRRHLGCRHSGVWARTGRARGRSLCRRQNRRHRSATWRQLGAPGRALCRRQCCRHRGDHFVTLRGLCRRQCRRHRCYQIFGTSSSFFAAKIAEKIIKNHDKFTTNKITQWLHISSNKMLYHQVDTHIGPSSNRYIHI